MNLFKFISECSISSDSLKKLIHDIHSFMSGPQYDKVQFNCVLVNLCAIKDIKWIYNRADIMTQISDIMDVDALSSSVFPLELFPREDVLFEQILPLVTPKDW